MHGHDQIYIHQPLYAHVVIQSANYDAAQCIKNSQLQVKSCKHQTNEMLEWGEKVISVTLIMVWLLVLDKAGLIIFETADLVEFSCTAISRIYTK